MTFFHRMLVLPVHYLGAGDEGGGLVWKTCPGLLFGSVFI